ncbi:MAG: hypothetical protein AB4911_10890 [Oscillochloridaceae bacterium umkhey_bin13]
MYGPIQLLAFAFDRIDESKPEILRELDELHGHGLIRVIDLLFIMRDEDGSVHALQGGETETVDDVVSGALLARLLGLNEADSAGALPDELLDAMMLPEPGSGMGDAEILAAAEGIPPGKAAALLLVEHDWAAGFATAVKLAGGRMVAQGFLTRDAVLAVGRELSAIVAAEVAVERAEAVRGAAMLDALTTIAAAEELREAAINEAVATVTGVDAFRSAIAAEAVRTLVVAGLIDEADAGAAIEALLDAELITTDAFQQATDAADAAAAELASLD